MVFDFVDGGAGSEASLRTARQAFRSVEFQPRALRDVSAIDLSVDFFGRESKLPFFLAPTGGTRLMHTLGEVAVARAAYQSGIPYTLSTLGTTSVEQIASAVPDGQNWFQLYLIRDRERAKRIIERARDAGFENMMVAVDCPVPGRRNRDVRNGLVVPPKLTWGSALKIAGYPRWWFDKLTTSPVEFAMIEAESESPAQRMARVFDPTITVADIEWLREIWPGKLIVKGLLSAEDAKDAANTGADAVYLSSHGGRQLDHSPVPFELVPKVRKAVGDDVKILVDGGIMSGADIVACYANGADGVGVGRAYLYGLMAAGEAGVARAIEMLRDEMRTTMALIGCRDTQEVRETGLAFRQF